MSRPKNDDQDLIVRAAWQYYVHGRGQELVAKSLDLSRTKVTRLLQQARESGIVKISLEHETVETLALGDWIAQRFGVESCVLTPPLPGDPEPSPTIEELSRQAVGIAAANLIARRCLNSKEIAIGLGAGRTVERVIESIANVSKSDLAALALVGTTHRDDGHSSYTLALRLAETTGGTATPLPVPLYMGSAETRAVVEADPTIQTLLAATARTDLNLLSCSAITFESAFAQRTGLTEGDCAALAAAGGVCEIAGLILDARGLPIDSALNRRRVGVSFEALRKAENIVVASGERKVGPLRAVLAAGLARTIVIDHAIAAELAKK